MAKPLVLGWNDNVYGASYHVLVCPMEEMNEWMRHRYPKGELRPVTALAGGTTYMIIQPTFTHIIIWFPPEITKLGAEAHGAIAHEAVHASAELLYARGVRFTLKSSEAFAYHQGVVVRGITQCLERFKKEQQNARRRGVVRKRKK